MRVSMDDHASSKSLCRNAVFSGLSALLKREGKEVDEQAAAIPSDVRAVPFLPAVDFFVTRRFFAGRVGSGWSVSSRGLKM
jgi:hypothetical protein